MSIGSNLNPTYEPSRSWIVIQGPFYLFWSLPLFCNYVQILKFGDVCYFNASFKPNAVTLFKLLLFWLRFSSSRNYGCMQCTPRAKIMAKVQTFSNLKPTWSGVNHISQHSAQDVSGPLQSIPSKNR